MVEQVAQLADLLPEYHWAYGAGMDLHADGKVVHRRRQFGNMGIRILNALFASAAIVLSHQMSI
jgi:hypothetical protein